MDTLCEFEEDTLFLSDFNEGQTVQGILVQDHLVTLTQCNGFKVGQWTVHMRARWGRVLFLGSLANHKRVNDLHQ